MSYWKVVGNLNEMLSVKWKALHICCLLNFLLIYGIETEKHFGNWSASDNRLLFFAEIAFIILTSAMLGLALFQLVSVSRDFLKYVYHMIVYLTLTDIDGKKMHK